MRVYIVSDFHLSFSAKNPAEEKRNSDVTAFLGTLAGKADILILAGDIFDLWYDWQNTIIKGYFPVLKKLADLSESGCRLIFIAGNHDFWFGNFLTSYLNCEIYPEHFSEVIDNKRVFIAHGDEHTANDIRYHIFRSVLRHPIVRFLFASLHPEIALRLGRLISRTSRKTSPEQKRKNPSNRSSGLDRAARELAGSHDLIVFGHSHKPVKMPFGNALYVNTGDWLTHRSYLLMNDGEVELLYYQD